MSWHKIHRTTLIYRAVLASLFGGLALNAHAISLGQADIHSAQHEPLSATITVSDIDAQNFHASIATPDIYAQMGLSPDAPIFVQFTPTSDSTGQITLSSNVPISTPFADIVLNLNNNGEQVIEPQTLLMPIPASSPFTIPDSDVMPVIVTEDPQNLPTTTPLDDFTQNNGADAIDMSAVDLSTPDLPAPTAMPNVNTNSTPVPPKDGKVIGKEEIVIAQTTPEGTNTQIDILTEQVTRRIYPAGQAPAHEDLTASAPIPSETPITPSQPEKQAPASTGQAVYVVQSGDSLWNIANQIAKANKMSVNDVMNAIHNANPDAFAKGNINNLKTNAKLALPNYDVIPSQKAIQDAISAKRSHDAKKTGNTTAKANTKPNNNKSTNQPTTAKATSKPSSGSTGKANTTASTKKALPKAQMTLVTPTQQGKATGTNNKPTQSATGGGGDMLAGSLKNTRSQTANHAEYVQNLSQQRSAADQRVKLQNQKLAELEARLKALKENK